ncbi:type II toxin-antitoxin system prevent-host-death family antitoxin [Novosphingobium resinovorum]|nr:type II toxin-antitoxin system prevent-host-death family antitoxin [Novosphingobium resinovorum]
MSYMTSAAFNQNPSKAKKAADQQPVVITDHGEEAYVLVRYAEFAANWKRSASLLESLRDPQAADDKDFLPDRTSFEGRDVEF